MAGNPPETVIAVKERLCRSFGNLCTAFVPHALSTEDLRFDGFEALAIVTER